MFISIFICLFIFYFGDKALRSVGPDAIADVMDMIDSTDRDRLAAYATGGCRQRPLPGFWSTSELAARS
jgi:hypothetical protein